MAIFKQFTYTKTGTEIEFLQGFIDLICGLDSDITCEDINGNETTAAAQFADLSSNSRADIFFNFGNALKIEFRRAASNASSTYGYQIINNGTQLLTLRYASSGTNVTTSAERSFFISYIKSSNVIALWLANYNVSAIANATYTLMRIKTANDNYLMNAYSNNPIGGTFTNDNSSVVLSTVLPYACVAGSVDIIEKTIFTSGGVKALEITDIKSCSTVSQFSSIALPNGKNYFAIGTNNLVEIEDEDDEEETT